MVEETIWGWFQKIPVPSLAMIFIDNEDDLILGDNVVHCKNNEELEVVRFNDRVIQIIWRI